MSYTTGSFVSAVTAWHSAKARNHGLFARYHYENLPSDAASELLEAIRADGGDSWLEREVGIALAAARRMALRERRIIRIAAFFERLWPKVRHHG